MVNINRIIEYRDGYTDSQCDRVNLAFWMKYSLNKQKNI